MINAREEFLETAVREDKSRTVLCAEIIHNPCYGIENVYQLKVSHTTDEYLDFLQSLDFDYDDGYGSQELFGIIWYTDGTWSTRWEYDGSECWSDHVCPEIPEELK